MKKETRLSLIAKGKDVIKEKLGIRTRKITRAITSAIDTAEENALNAEEKIPVLLNKLGEVADDVKSINQVIDEICTCMDESKAWKEKKKQVEKLQAMLNEEVEVEE